MTEEKLFFVKTDVKVEICWFFPERRQPSRRYAELILGYVPNSRDYQRTERAIDELFTEDEAKQLAAYIDQNRRFGRGSTTVIKPVKLPLSSNASAFQTTWDLYSGGLEEIDDDLPFKAHGCYDF